MCSHSSTGLEITEKISLQLYPNVSTLLQRVALFFEQREEEEKEQVLRESLEKLRSEFESLKNYEVKLVFPSVLKVFNTKDNPDIKPSINIIELQRLTKSKEAVIMDLIDRIKEEVSTLSLPLVSPFSDLITLMENSFVNEKKQWNNMLNGWSLGCACFVAAQQH